MNHAVQVFLVLGACFLVLSVLAGAIGVSRDREAAAAKLLDPNDHTPVDPQAAREIREQRVSLPIVIGDEKIRSLRPSRNVIVVSLWVCMGLVSAMQLLGGVSPTSINSAATMTVQDALSACIITVSLFNLMAAAIKHDGIALGIEVSAMLFGASGFLVYLGLIVDTEVRWWLTPGFAWSLALLMGTVSRAVQIFKRGY